jgi:hypothetical protein
MPADDPGRTGRTAFHRSAWKVYSANFAQTAFSEDEMRRPTPYAVPYGLQLFDGLLRPREEDRPTMDASKERPKMTAGLDLGDKYSYLCLIDQESGEVIEEGRLRTTPEALRRRFASEQHLRIAAIEAGTHSPWASRVLEECGHEVLVANARKLRLIYSNKRKTDEVDAENLARLARVDPKLLFPLKHRGEESQAHIAIIRSRGRHWSGAARSWSTTSEGRSSPSAQGCPSARRSVSTRKRLSTYPRRFGRP